ncbi:MAG: transporter [Dysgonamonadaceae bacterium]
MIKLLKPYMMPLSMLAGALFYPFFSLFHFLTPGMIFCMLFISYCGIQLKNIRFSMLHMWLILIQVGGSIAVYQLLKDWNLTLAQAGLICFFMPTATSAVVITGMLKGNTASLIAYSLLSNLAVVALSPVYFSLVGTHQHLSFFVSFLSIAQRVCILLIGPFILAACLRRFFPVAAEHIQRKSVISFYLWVFALAIVTASTVKFITLQNRNQLTDGCLITLLSLVICLFQFLAGKKMGGVYNDKIAGGQGLGQKNTIFAIWLTLTYLNPAASLGPGAYILWQNIINSWQVWRMRKVL